MQGIVIQYNTEKGYGFIKSEEEDNIFIHASDIKHNAKLSQGQRVSFKVKKTKKGLSAIELKAGTKPDSPYYIFAMVSLFFTLAIFALLYQYSHAIIAYLIAINITTFLFYGYDKGIAGGTNIRVPEYNLHALALLGGSPFGLLAQKVFRHKTIKGSFQLFYWGIVFVQVGVLVWLFAR